MQPWYKQFWPWFLITLPVCAVVASCYTFYIAATDPADLVVADYYKEGKAINLELTELNAAQSRHIRATVTQVPGGLDMVLSGDDLEPGLAVKLSLHHATLARNDFDRMLTANAAGVYHLALDHPMAGRWHLQAEPFDGQWRVQAQVDFDEEHQAVLTGEP